MVIRDEGRSGSLDGPGESASLLRLVESEPAHGCDCSTACTDHVSRYAWNTMPSYLLRSSSVAHRARWMASAASGNADSRLWPPLRCASKSMLLHLLFQEGVLETKA
ncbi:hypothetical protein ACFYXM_11055 [Streptomyces sp. NPDC002476]|uniref:hypothetical protein n=1 Tax=Streptomyces sp. NPDC002476 TaxID=3364648 RepID=UPI0036854EC6